MDDEQEESRLQKIDRNFTLVFCGVLFLVSVLFVLFSSKLDMFSRQRVLGPGIFPLVVFAINAALAVWLAVQVLTGKGSSAKVSEHISFERIKKPFFLYGRIFIAVALLQVIGFVLSLILFVFTDMWFFSEKKLKLPFVIACSVIIPVTVYVVFHFLNIELPSPAWLPF